MHTKTVNGRKTAWSGNSDVHVKTNYRERELVPYHMLPTTVQSDFSYVLPDFNYGETYESIAEILESSNYALIENIDNCRFFEFCGAWYDVQEFEIASYDFRALGWDAWQTESAFSAVLVQWFDKYGHERDGVVVGYAHW